MSRREMREQIFKLLFRVEFNSKEELAQQEAFFFEDEENAATGLEYRAYGESGSYHFKTCSL